MKNYAVVDLFCGVGGFSRNYDFINPDVKFLAANSVRQIGNAVPVGLEKKYWKEYS